VYYPREGDRTLPSTNVNKKAANLAAFLLTSPPTQANLCLPLKNLQTDARPRNHPRSRNQKCRYSVRIQCNAVEVSLRRFQVYPHAVQRVLDDVGMEGLYTTN
jgi:hypothetical protein